MSGTTPPITQTPSPAECVERRRAVLKDQGRPVSAAIWGLALSGGGIRSATFCLGLISGLAKQKIFHRFDYMSTVSGGGYAGAAVGKLYHDADGTAGLREQQLGQMRTSWFVWWLRATSRYLTPRGLKDLLLAGALMLRNLLAVHIELALLGIVAGGAMAAVNLAVWWGLDRVLPGHGWLLLDVAPLLRSWISVWWVLAAVPCLAALPIIADYWAVPTRGGSVTARRWPPHLVLSTCSLLLGTAAAVTALKADTLWHGLPDSSLRWSCATAALMLLLVGTAPAVLALIRHRLSRLPGGSELDLRNRLTSWLATCLRVALALAALGAIDRMAWFMAFSTLGPDSPLFTPALLAGALGLTRALAARVSTHRATQPLSPALTRKLLDAAGVALLVLLIAWWVSLVYRHALGVLFAPAFRPHGALAFDMATAVLAGIVVAPLLYIGLTRRNDQFLNLSSLHMFYKARLTRSYLGAANNQRFTRPPLPVVDPLAPADSALAALNARELTVFDVHPADTVTLDAYAPHAHGGPVHIINTTVNQTYDSRGGLFNQDRKGQSLSVAGGGWSRVGTDDWIRDEDIRGTELPLWMAISGAAFTPGLGGQTSAGLAALLYMAGVRLGYWWRRAANPASGLLGLMPKYGLMVAEARGYFGGIGAPYWYLSDGGHFENTGAYALLREGADLIVLADCGADPLYRFEDVENLVRKARIDLNTDIEFWRPLSPAPPGAAGMARFGALSDLKDPAGNACLALARICYPDRPPGFLVLVKPNIYQGLPIDLINYKINCASFPQETTTDQFFSESQWESYFNLGRSLGLELELDLLAALDNTTITQHFEPDNAQRPGAGPSSAVPAIPSRIGAVAKPALSLAAIATLAFAGWQGWDTFLSHRSEDLANLREAVHAASIQNERVNGGDLAELPALRANLANIVQRYCDDGSSELSKLQYAVKIFKDVIPRCNETLLRTAGQGSPACEVLTQRQTAVCLEPPVNKDAPVYWGRAYDEPQTLRVARAQSVTESESVKTVTAPPAPPPSPPPPAPASVTATAAAPAQEHSPAAMKASGVTAAVRPTTAIGSSATTEVSAGAGSPGAADSTTAKACNGKTIYVQIYGPQQRPRAMQLAKTWTGWGATVPGVEDVVATAAARQKDSPVPMRQTTVIYHTAAEKACATLLGSQSLGTAVSTRPLPASIPGQPGHLEVWLAAAPRDGEAGSGERNPPALRGPAKSAN